jgi:serine/threonine protein kinase
VISLDGVHGGGVAGRFTLERAAGEGGMATVYRARDGETGATVAVKLLLDRGAEPHRTHRRESVRA